MTTNATLEAANKSQRETIERLQNEIEEYKLAHSGVGITLIKSLFAARDKIKEKDKEIKRLNAFIKTYCSWDAEEAAS